MLSAEPDEAEITWWALAVRAGDRAAAAAFIRATQQSVHRFLTHLVDVGEAEDLTQETYLRAMRALPRFATRSSARTWLLAIARRVAADHIRTAIHRPRLAAGDQWELAAEAARADVRSRVEDQVVIGQLLRDLPAERREAFVATQIVGLTYAEAARVCDCPIGTIRSRGARAREDLVVAMDARDARDARHARGGSGRSLRSIGCRLQHLRDGERCAACRGQRGLGRLAPLLKITSLD